MDYQLWHGDCLEEMGRIEDGSVDAIICDLPYGRTNCFWDVAIPFEPLWKHYRRVIKKNGAIALFGAEPFSSLLRLSNFDWYKYDWYLRKNKTTGHLNAKKQPLRKYEIVSVFYKGQCTFNPQFYEGAAHGTAGAKKLDTTNVYGKQRLIKPAHKSSIYFPNNEIDVRVAKFPIHPNEKSITLMEYLIKTYTNEGDLILDNTFGSCSTGEAAIRTGRRFIGIEKDPTYFEIGKARMERVAAELRGELNHLPMFAEVAV